MAAVATAQLHCTQCAQWVPCWDCGETYHSKGCLKTTDHASDSVNDDITRTACTTERQSRWVAQDCHATIRMLGLPFLLQLVELPLDVDVGLDACRKGLQVLQYH